eukprot:5041282-Pleurochrysis_carterae.AAC.5
MGNASSSTHNSGSRGSDDASSCTRVAQKEAGESARSPLSASGGKGWYLLERDGRRGLRESATQAGLLLASNDEGSVAGTCKDLPPETQS